MSGQFGSLFEMKKLSDLFVISVLSVLVVIAVRHASVPDVAPASASENEFSDIAVMSHLRKIAIKPHPTGTAANAEVRQYLLDEVRRQGLVPEVQTAVGVNAAIGENSAGLVHNVMVRVPGQATGKAVLVMAHYDSAPNSFGAADDGLAVASMLETMRVIKRGPALKNDVLFLFTDGEESGLLGADAFAADAVRMGQVGMVLNFDYRGNRGPLLMFETSGPNSGLVKGLAQLPLALGNSLMGEIYKRMPNGTDMRAFKLAGVPGMNFAAIERATHYHTNLDSIENVGAGTLHHTGQTMLALARYFGKEPLQALEQGADSVYFDVAILGMVSYPSAWTWPLTIVGIGFFIGVAVMGVKRGEMRVGRTLLSALGLAVVVVLLVVASQAAWVGILALHPGYKLMQLGETYNGHWYFMAFATLFGALFLIGQSVLRKWLRPFELVAGGTLLWLAFLIAANILVPGATYVFFWPLLAVLLVMAFLLSARGQGASPWLRLNVLLLGAVPGILILAPLIWQIFVALTPRMFGVPMLLLLLLLTIGTPLVREFTRPRLIPAALLCAAALGLAMGARTSDFDPAKPRPNNLSYVQNGAADAAFWLSSDARLDAWTGSFFKDVAGPRKLPELFGERLFMLWAAPAPARGLPLPTAELVDDRSSGTERTVTLRIMSPRMAPKLTLEVEGATILRSELASRPLTSGPDQHWRLHVYGVQGDGMLLKLVLKPGVPFKLRMIDTTYGLPLDPGQRRPAGMQAKPIGDSDTTGVIAVAEFS